MLRIPRSIIFIIIAICLVVFFSIISNILLPFVVGIILAYFLDPAADKLEKRGFSRGKATLLILMLFIIFISLFSYTIGPILYRQLVALVTQIPSYIRTFNAFVTPYLDNIYGKFGYEDGAAQSMVLKEISEYALTVSKNIFSNLWSSSIAVINLFALIVITPIVTFYLLRDWDIMLDKLSAYIPKKYKTETIEQFSSIDNVLSAYIRGQTNVCLILGAFYAVGLSVVGLDFGFLIGFLTGVFTFVPYFGVFVGMFIGVVLSLLQFDTYLPTLLVLGVFILGQFIEGNFITPKLVGEKVGVHPVLIIFSLLAGGTLFGFVGVLFAIPAIAIIGVLTRLCLRKYVKSKFYLN